MDGDANKLINKLFDMLNELIYKNDLSAKSNDLSNELLETLKILENCTRCKYILGKDHFKEFHESIDRIKDLSDKLEEEGQQRENIIHHLSNRLIKIDTELNNKVLCKDCKEKEIEKLTNKYGNEEIARFFHEGGLNAKYYDYIRWIPFNEFRNIEYLAKGGFGKVYKATWTNYYDHFSTDKKHKKRDVILKNIHNSNNKVLDILKEVKV